MNKFLLLILIAFAASRNVILIGDSRYVGMAAMMGFQYSTITKYYGTGTNIRSTTPISYKGDSFQVTAQVSASAYTFTAGSEIYNSVHSQLQKASPGTNVLLWLGINDCSAVESTFTFYRGLANKYSSLKFYAISITGINESKTYLKNSSAQSFNAKLADKINRGKISNLKYKSILSGNDVNTIIVGGQKIAIINYMTGDGLHYTKEGYIKLWQAMATQF